MRQFCGYNGAKGNPELTHASHDVKGCAGREVRVSQQHPEQIPLVLKVQQSRLVPQEAERCEQQTGVFSDEPEPPRPPGHRADRKPREENNTQKKRVHVHKCNSYLIG